MKALVSLLSLAIFSSNVLAARLPTYEEGLEITNKIDKSNSISDIFASIKNNKLDPIYVYSGENYVKDGNKSTILAKIIVHRMNTSNPIGNLQENLALMDLIVSKGADINSKQTDNDQYTYKDDFWNGFATLVTMAADACSLETIKLLEKKGADLGAETFNWARALHQATQRDASIDQPCKDVAEYLISKSREVDFYVLKSLFFTADTNERFIQGNYLDEVLTPNLADKMKGLLNVTLSKKPESAEPSDDWISDFLKRLAMPTTAQGDWWALQDSGHKAWACYYSSFDEAVEGFNTIGMTRDWLTKNSIGGRYVFGSFSPFMVYDFTNYCNSIK